MPVFPRFASDSMLEGLPPNNAAHLMRLDCSEAQGRAIADLIVETFDPADVAVGAFEKNPNAESWVTEHWCVEAFFGTPPDEASVRDLVRLAAGEDCARAAIFERVNQRDWVAASLAGLNDVRAGRFLLHGAHGRGRVRANDIGLEIEAALAFGTGHHGTTRGCLLMFDALLKRRRPRGVLDIGTGTGVLAMAAARALHIKIAAGDIDPVAVTAAISNARLNHVAALVRPVVARGTDHPALRSGAPYDLIFANILARPLRLLAPAICGLAAHNGEIILSGLLLRDVPGIASAYAAQGYFLWQRSQHEGWASLLLRRGGSAARPA